MYAGANLATDEAVYTDGTMKRTMSVSPDGTLLMYGRSDRHIWIAPLTRDSTVAGANQRRLTSDAFEDNFARFSPDGRWVAYAAGESPVFEIYVVPFPGPGGKYQISTNGGYQPRWRRDGKELFYVTRDGQLMSAPVTVRENIIEVGRVQKLFGGIVTSRGLLWDASLDDAPALITQRRNPLAADAGAELDRAAEEMRRRSESLIPNP